MKVTPIKFITYSLFPTPYSGRDPGSCAIPYTSPWVTLVYHPFKFLNDEVYGTVHDPWCQPEYGKRNREKVKNLMGL